MEGYEAFRKLREEKGISIREFAALTDIAPRTITYYGNGQIDLSKITVIKAYRIFLILECSVTEFYDKYFPYKEEILRKKQLWCETNKRDYDYMVLKKRVYARIAKLKEREKITINQFEELKQDYHQVFAVLETKLVNGMIDDTLYEEYLVPLLFKIKSKSAVKANNAIAQRFLEALYKTDYKIKDLAHFCELAEKKCIAYLNGVYNFEDMHVITALKLCYVLELDFEEVFCQFIDNKQKK